MHAAVEVVLPPAPGEDPYKHLKFRLGQILESAKTVGPEHNWWDWYTIGGRFGGKKLMARLDEEQVKAFYAELTRLKVTVSAVIAGKESIHPDSQIPAVDEAWRRLVPGQGDVCPFFSHYKDEHTVDGINKSDICLVKDLPEKLTTLVIVVANADDDAVEVVHHEYFDGKKFKKTEFDGNVKSELPKLLAKKPELGVGPDWIVVTVDTHN